jgi:hypothetical protein
MRGNPLTHNATFYRLTWGDLISQTPYASPMQRYEAAERLIVILNSVFTSAAREMAFEYEKQNSQEIPSSYAPDLREPDRSTDQGSDPA